MGCGLLRPLPQNANKLRPAAQAGIFRDTYGCYVMHCGALAMGCPSPEDDHGHHGELPYVTYDRAFLVSGEDEKGRYMGVTGEYEYNRAFGSHYMARPIAKVYEGSTLIDVGIEIEYGGASDGPDVYVPCQQRPEPGAGNLSDASMDSGKYGRRVSIPQYNEPDPAFMELLGRVQKDVSVTRVIGEGDVYDPEIVLFLRGVRGDEKARRISFTSTRTARRITQRMMRQF